MIMYAEMSPDIKKQITPETEEKVPIEVTTEASEEHRDRNEDAVFVDKEKELAGLFDGMGGGMAGEKASQLAAKVIYSELSKVPKGASSIEWQNAIRQAMEKAQQEVTKFGNEIFFESIDDPFARAAYRDRSQEEIQKFIIERGVTPTGTTASIAKLIELPDGGADLVYGHTGDSRIYVLRKDGQLEQITRDQSALEEAVQNGYITKEEADFLDQATSNDEILKKFGPEKGKTIAFIFKDLRRGVKNALGLSESNFQIGSVHLEPGEKVIITSDGIHDNLTKKEIEKIAAQAKASAALVEAAKKRRSEKVLRSKSDDKTAIVLEVPEIIESAEIIEEPEEIIELKTEDVEEIPTVIKSLEEEDRRKSAAEIKKIKKSIGI